MQHATYLLPAQPMRIQIYLNACTTVIQQQSFPATSTHSMLRITGLLSAHFVGVVYIFATPPAIIATFIQNLSLLLSLLMCLLLLLLLSDCHYKSAIYQTKIMDLIENTKFRLSRQ